VNRNWKKINEKGAKIKKNTTGSEDPILAPVSEGREESAEGRVL